MLSDEDAVEVTVLLKYGIT